MPDQLALPPPDAGVDGAVEFVARHFVGLFSGPLAASERFRGGQRAADGALAAFDVAGYASARNEVWPTPRRGASALSPYIRHNILTLERVWSAVGDGPSRDRQKFRDELLWQEYARHWYARLGPDTAVGQRHRLAGTARGEGGWSDEMACMNMLLEELHDDGWLVNQSRMWMASHWAVRRRGQWQRGEDEFFRHLLDGSRAANRLGWQWTTGAGSRKAYGFSRWQVEKRAPGLCGQCELSASCPIERWPDEPDLVKVEPNPALRRAVDPTAEAGPGRVVSRADPDCVWMTAESLGDEDPALAAHPGLPVVFVFDRPLLSRLQLSAKRVVFLVETLAEIAAERPVEVYLGDPILFLADRAPTVTFAPVPGFHRIADAVPLAEIHPYPWLRRPQGHTVASFSAWRKRLGS